MSSGTCRFCGAQARETFADLGMQPPSNSYVPRECANSMEAFFPLHAFVCTSCFLVQLEAYESPEDIFGDYAYFSSYSDSWLAHAKRYTEMMIDRFGIDSTRQVVELASNDGYLLQYFKEKNIPVLGIEPAANVAAVAEANGIPSIVRFFGEEMAKDLVAEGITADLIIGNNVLAHVPDLNDFVAGQKRLLAPEGLITIEFPHLMRLIEGNQFDTIYHEHFSYFSFITVEQVFATHGLVLFDVEELSTHGGSLRIYGRHDHDETKPVSDRAHELKRREAAAGLCDVATYRSFSARVAATKRRLLSFLIDARESGKSVVGYGAPAKGNTLLNYCGIGTDFLDYTVDRNPHKQNHLLPGSHIPVHGPEMIRETKPDYVLILPWNLKDEIASQMAFIREWGGRFVVPIPEVEVLP